MTWRLIEYAPTDELILGWADGMMRLVFWSDGKWLQIGNPTMGQWVSPTHWMFLPHPPKGDTE